MPNNIHGEIENLVKALIEIANLDSNHRSDSRIDSIYYEPTQNHPEPNSANVARQTLRQMPEAWKESFLKGIM